VRDDEREREARETLDRVARESETIGSSSLGRLGRRAGDHFAAKDALGEAEGGTDPIELWGRRIGRALSLIGVIVLAYLLGVQLRLW
jgi:hypothetical protein